MSTENKEDLVEVTQQEKKEEIVEELNGLNIQEDGQKVQQEEEFKVNRSNEESVNYYLLMYFFNKSKENEETNQNDDEKTKEEGEGNEEEDKIENDDEDEKDEEEEIPESEKTLEQALEYKEKANKYFYEQLFDDAIEYYYKALKYCPKEEVKQCAVLNSNLAICYLKKNDYETVIEYSSESIKLDPTFKKPYLNRITAYEKTEKLEEAIEDLKELEKLDPSDNQIKAKIFVMQKDLEKLNEKRKTEVLSGLKDLGNTILGKFGLSLDNFKLNKNDNGSFNVQFSK